MKGEQKRLKSSEKFQQDCKNLNLVQNTEGIYECRSRIQEVIQSIYQRSHCKQKKLFGLHIRKPYTGSHDHNVKYKNILLDIITQKGN